MNEPPCQCRHGAHRHYVARYGGCAAIGCPCPAYRASSRWRVKVFALALGSWFDRDPATFFVLTPWRPDEELMRLDFVAQCTTHQTAFLVAQAMADMDVLRQARREAMRSGRHPAGHARARAHAAFDSVLVAEERLNQARRRAYYAEKTTPGSNGLPTMGQFIDQTRMP
jgi:hypothetical protein